MLTPGTVRSWYNTCIYFQDVKDFLSCGIVVIITNYAAAQKKTTVTGGITNDKGSGTRADFGISHKRGNWNFDGSGFGISTGHRGGSLEVSHKHKNLEFGGSVFGDNRGNRGGRLELLHKHKKFEIGGSIFGDNRGHRGGRLELSHKSKKFEIGGSVYRDNRGDKGASLGFKWRIRRSTQWVRFKFIYVNNCFFHNIHLNN